MYVSILTLACFTVPDDSVLVSVVFIKRPWHFLWFIILRSSIWSDSFASSLAHSCYNVSSILSEFHLEHEGPRTKNQSWISRLCVGKHLPSKKRCFLNSEHKNSMNISPFLWCCLAAASKYFPQNMVVCFHNIFFVIWYKCILYLVCVTTCAFLVHIETHATLPFSFSSSKGREGPKSSKHPSDTRNPCFQSPSTILL